MLVFKRDICIKSWVASDQIINNTVKRQLLCETAARANIIPLQSLALKGLCPCLKCTVRCSSHNQNERKKKKKTFQNVQIPHKIGMFVQHQKGTAGWRCSIWPNMEGKNAAFSRNQTGKKKENEKKKKSGKVFLHAACTAKMKLSHSLTHSGRRVGFLSKQLDWWGCWTCGDTSADAAGRGCTPARPPFLCAEISHFILYAAALFT